MAPKRKPVVFISHITEEKDIAIALKNLLETSFLNAVEFFVSSDDKSIPMGADWLQTVKDNLTNCISEIVIASSTSIGRVWIGFEAGAVWIQGKPVIALCHSGITKNQLPPPLGHLQGADANNEADLKRIIENVAKQLGLSTPTVDFSQFSEEVRVFEELSALSLNLDRHALLPPTGDLSAIEVAALRAIASYTQSLFDYISFSCVVSTMNDAGLDSAAASISIKILSRKRLIDISRYEDRFGNTEVSVKMLPEGWNWLEANHERIDFEKRPPPNPF